MSTKGPLTAARSRAAASPVRHGLRALYPVERRASGARPPRGIRAVRPPVDQGAGWMGAPTASPRRCGRRRRRQHYRRGRRR